MFWHQTKGFCFRSSENISSKLHFCYWEISAVYIGALEYFRFFSVLTISSRLPKIPWFASPRPACWGEQTSDWPADRCWSYPRPGWTASASEKFKESEVSWSKEAGEEKWSGESWWHVAVLCQQVAMPHRSLLGSLLGIFGQTRWSVHSDLINSSKKRADKCSYLISWVVWFCIKKWLQCLM